MSPRRRPGLPYSWYDDDLHELVQSWAQREAERQSQLVANYREAAAAQAWNLQDPAYRDRLQEVLVVDGERTWAVASTLAPCTP